MSVYDVEGRKIDGSDISQTMALGAAVLLDRPIPRKMEWELNWHGSGEFLQQGVCVAGDYIVSAWNPHLGTYIDKTNEIYFINKRTMQLATLEDSQGNSISNPVILTYSSDTTPTRSHANSLTYVPQTNEVYVNSMYSNKSYAIELTDFTVSTKTTPITATAFAYDPITSKWCYVTKSGDDYSIKIYDYNNSTLLKTVTIPFKNSQQGCMFYNGLIYLVKSEFETSDPYTDNPLFAMRQLILVIDTDGNLLKSWWFGSRGYGKIEFEDIDIVEQGKVVIGVNFNNAVGMLYEMQIMPENNSPNLDKNDTYSIIQLDQRTEFMTSCNGINLNTLTYDGRYFVEQSSSNSNLPTGITSGWIDIFLYRANNAVIVKQVMYDSTSEKIATRTCSNIEASSPTWSTWTIV